MRQRYISDPLLQNQDETAETRAKKLHQISADHLYSKLQNHAAIDMSKSQQKTHYPARKLGIPLAATNDNHYVYKKMPMPRKLTMYPNQTTVDTPNRSYL